MQPLYPILDVEAAAAGGHDLVACAQRFAALGLDLQQLRAKCLPDREFLDLAQRLAAVVPQLIINDRADIALLSGAAGVHVGQDDLPVTTVRALHLAAAWRSPERQRADPAGNRSAHSKRPTGATRANSGEPHWRVGASTHSLEQARATMAMNPDYLAIGPIYPTRTKRNPDPVVGCTMVRAMRELTDKPLVAIGGIQLHNCAAVWRAGADAVAVISGLWSADDPISAARQFLLAFARV
ncbi:MAG: thiamine phosphate synthase [Acidobacteria bacterium]|nr:MAG: thiamine phosphate synthase [Acidobacteriota bacterium]